MAAVEASSVAGTGVEVPVLDLFAFAFGATPSDEAVALTLGAGMVNIYDERRRGEGKAERRQTDEERRKTWRKGERLWL